MIKEIKLNRFDLGISDETRDLPNGYFRYLENVGSGDKIRSLRQVANMSEVDASNTKKLIATFSIGDTVFGLGDNGGTPGKVCIYTGVTPYAAANWSVDTPAAQYNWTAKSNPFFLYNGGTIYFDNLNKIGQYIIGGAMDGDWSSLTGGLYGGCLWQGNMYGWGANNHIYKVVVTAPTDMITIPADQTIVDLIPWGNLMAIICTSSVGDCKMYIWDGVTTTTFYDIVKIGYGTVIGGALLDDVITVIIKSANGEDFRIKRYNGQGFSTEYYYSGRANTAGTTYTNLISKVKSDKGYIYFPCRGTRSGSATTNSIFLFRYGRKTSQNPTSFCIYKDFNLVPTNPNNYVDFTIISNVSGLVNDTAFFAIISDTGSSDTVKELASLNIFTGQPGVIETGIFIGGDSSIEKQLKAISLQYAPLPTAGQVILKYRKDAETAWTTIFTDTTDYAVSHEAVNIESTGANLPQFKEIAFRIELSGGAELSGIKFKWESESNIYGD